jgi:hypothetical protein
MVTVDTTRFDQLTRQLATGASRRQVLKGIVGFVVGSVLSQVWSRRNVYAQGDQERTIYLPLANKVCSEGSQCNDRKYCGDFPNCICIEAAEGDIRCGKIPSTCNMPLCTTSADCAHLGPGYFCDVPNSGCCTDPPASLARCIPPCTGDCPAAQRCGVACCAEGDVCANDRCVSPDDCDIQSVTLESMRAGLAKLAADTTLTGVTSANLSPQGCIQLRQTKTNGAVTIKSLTIGKKKVSEWIRSGKQWLGYRDADLDNFYDWRSTTVDGATPDEYVTTELEYSPTTTQLMRRTTLTSTAAGVHVKVEERGESATMIVVEEYDAPLIQGVSLADAGLLPDAETGVDTPAATCEADPCNVDGIKARMEEGTNLALQCLSNFGDRGVAIFEAALNTLSRNMTVQCAAIPGETQAQVGGWNHPQGTLTVTVDPTKFCALSEGQRAWLLFHEILHAALRYSHNPSVEKLPLDQRNQLDRIYGCIALCYTHASDPTRCMCAQCLGTVTCDPLCAAFKSDCGATCPCPEKDNEYFTTCSQCLVACPSGLACFGYSTCDPVGQSHVCLPVTCP